VRGGHGTLIVLDCGTAARGLGLHLAEIALPPRLHLFIGHTHWDHIQGFPFFVPAFMPGAELNIYAPLGFQRGLEEAMAGQMEYSYFPVKLRDLRSRIHFTELDERFFRAGWRSSITIPATTTRPSTGWRRWPATASAATSKSLPRPKGSRSTSAVAAPTRAPRPTCRRWCVVPSPAGGCSSSRPTSPRSR